MRFLSIFSFILWACVTMQAERLTFSGLKEGESIVIGYRAVGCWSSSERCYVIQGGERPRFVVYERAPSSRAYLTLTDLELPVGVGQLSGSEALGLDSYAYYMGVKHEVISTNADIISLSYYRGNKKIGEDSYEDNSGGVAQFRYEKGRLVVPEQMGREVSARLFKSIVPPWVIEERIVQPQQALGGFVRGVTVAR